MGREDLPVRWEQCEAKAAELKEAYKKPKVLHNFYSHQRGLPLVNLRSCTANGRCERCGQIGIEVHHKERLTVDNVN